MTLWYVNFILLCLFQDDVSSHMVENMEVNVKRKCYSTLDHSKIITVAYFNTQYTKYLSKRFCLSPLHDTPVSIHFDGVFEPFN